MVTTSEQKPERAFTATFALLVTALACSIVLIATPRAVMPSRLPALRLAPLLVSAQLEADRKAAARAPRRAEVREFLRVYGEEGRAELDQRVELARLAELRAELKERAAALAKLLGDEGMRALLASLVERAMAALAAYPTSGEARELLGSFPTLLVRYGYVDARGALLAPALSVRAMYKARFNVLAGRPLERDLSRIEQQAYEGYNALHAAGLPPERRALAAKAFHDAGGAHAAEALGIWLYHGGARDHALELLRAEHARTGALRLRNMALFALRP